MPRGNPDGVPQTITDAQWTRICAGALDAFPSQDRSDAWAATTNAIARNAGSN